MQPGDSLYPRYCSLCGARFAESEPRCPECSAAWLLPVANTFYTLALILHDIQDRHRDKAINDVTYLRLVRLYEARLEGLRRPAVAAAPSPVPAHEPAHVPIPVASPHPAAAIPPRPAPAPVFTVSHAPAAMAPAPAAALPPRPVRPPKPPRPPGPSAPRVAFNWAAKRQADLLLYLGAFLMSIAALIFVNYQGSGLSGIARTSVLASYALAFLILGLAVRRWERVREAGPVFVGLGALLTPLTFLMLYVRVLNDQDVPVAWTWLAGSITTSVLYFLLVRTGYGRLYAVPATIAALMAWGSLGATVEIGEEWYGAWFAALAPVANALGAYRFRKYQKWAELAAVVLVVPSVVFAQGAALVEDVTRWELPVTYAFLLAAVVISVHATRKARAWALLPVSAAATAGTAAWAATVPSLGELDWAPSWILAAAAGYLVIGHFHPKAAQSWAMAAGVVAAAAAVGAHISCGDSEPRALLPVVYGGITAGIAAAWWRWRWEILVDMTPLATASFLASLSWAGWEAAPGTWGELWLIVAAAGYLGLALLPRSGETVRRAGMAAVLAAGAVVVAHAVVADGNDAYRLPATYALVTAGAGVLYWRWRWDVVLDGLPVLVAATTSSTIWWTLEVGEGSWQQTGLLVASAGYLGLAMLPSKEVQGRALAAAVFAGGAILLSHNLVAEGEERWRLALSYGFATAGAGVLYWRWRWDVVLDALPVLVAATTSSTIWWTLEVGEGSWQQTGLLVAAAGYLGLAMLPSKEVQGRALAAAAFAGGAIFLSHNLVSEGEERWRLALSYGFAFVGATTLYGRWQWPLVLGSLPILGSATLFTSLWAAADIPPEWFTLGPAAAGTGYLGLAWFDRARERPWRQMAALAGVSTIAGGHIAAATPDTSPWQLPISYGAVLLGSLWDALPARHERSWLLVPALAGMTGSTALWAADVPAAHWAWPPVAAGLAIAASELWWRNRPALARVGWPYALALALVPLGFIGEYVDTPWAGTTAFALSGLAFTWAAVRSHGAFLTLGGLEPTSTALLVERQMLGRAGSALFFGAAAYLNLALELEAAEGAWTYAAIGTGAWLGIAAFARLERSVTGVLVPVAATGLGLALFIAREDYGQSAVMLGAWSAASAVSIIATRRWIATAPVAAGVAGTLAYAWASREWPAWSLAVVYAGMAIATAAALTRWRDYGRSERSRVVTALSTVPAALAFAVAITTVNWRGDQLSRLPLAGRPDLVTTDEWAAMAGILVAFGAALFLEGLRLRLRVLAVSGTAAAMLGLEFAIATFQPENVQAYTAPLAFYLVGLGMTYRRSSELFGRHMYLHEALIAGGAAVLVLPGAEQALSPGGDKWGLILIAEAFLLLAAGFALSQRWLVVPGVLTIGGVGFRYFSTGSGKLPYWLTLGIAGLILLGFGVLLLSAREWWDRTRLRIGHWWLEGDEESRPPPAPPAPRPPRGGAAASPPAAPKD